MELDIRRLAPDMLEDYLFFFDNVAFADHKEWANCYCMHFHSYDGIEAEFKAYESSGKTGFVREKASQFIKEGIIRGYLAYYNSRVAGWCSANDKQNYSALKNNVSPDLWTDDINRKIKSLVCFLIAPDMRGRSVSARLLERVCADAETDGYECVEAYPVMGGFDMYAAHRGTAEFFGKRGFVIHRQSENGGVMRKYL